MKIRCDNAYFNHKKITLKVPSTIYTKWLVLAWTLWWDEDRTYGCPIEFNIHTSKYYWLWRPFSNSQRYNWGSGRYGDERVHLSWCPQNPEIWKSLQKRRSK